MKHIWELTSLKEASSRPEFYNFMTVGLKTIMFDAYKSAQTTWQKFTTMETSTKDKEGYPSIGNVGEPKQVLEGEEFQERPIGQDDMVEVTNYKYGEIIAITREMIDDDQTKQVARQPLDLGNAHAKFEDKAVYSIITGNGAIYDTNNLFSVNHPGFTGGPAIAQNDNIYTNVTLSANALAVAIGMIAQWRGHTVDDILDVQPRALLVPKNLVQTAKLLTAMPILPAYGAGVLSPASASGHTPNVLTDYNLEVISSPRLDTASSTDWYVITDFPVGLVYQLRDALDLLKENEQSGVTFQREVYRWKSRKRFGLKFVNWRKMLLVS